MSGTPCKVWPATTGRERSPCRQQRLSHRLASGPVARGGEHPEGGHVPRGPEQRRPLPQRVARGFEKLGPRRVVAPRRIDADEAHQRPPLGASARGRVAGDHREPAEQRAPQRRDA